MSKDDVNYVTQGSHYSALPDANRHPPSPLFDDVLQITDRGSAVDLAAWEQLLRFDPDQHGTEVLDINKRIPAGWTYFGQLMSHDLSCLRGLYVDPEDRHRSLGYFTPGLDLHTLYGLGPQVQSGWYELEKDPEDAYAFRGVRFVLERYRARSGETVFDVPRKHNKLPLIADMRNDDNFLLCQLLCVFMRFHNAVALYFHRQDGLSEERLFEKTKTFVTWTYQWLIIHDYLQKLTPDGFPARLLDGLNSGDKTVFKLLRDKLEQRPVLIPEFIHAAMRVGHSQVRGTYQLKPGKAHVKLFADNTGQLDLRGFKRDSRREAPDWNCFFGTGKDVQKSRLMDLLLAQPLNHLPFPPKYGENLGYLNLRRSAEMGMVLPADTTKLFEEKLGIQQGINAAIIRAYFPKSRLNTATDHWVQQLCQVQCWPLWAYVLMEARLYGCTPAGFRQQTQPEQTLGPLGAHIIAEQILWILYQSKNSFLHRRGMDWSPEKEIPAINRITDFMTPFSINTLIHIANNGIPV